MFKTEGIGALTKDPELRTVKIGDQDVEVCDIRVAFEEFLGKTKHVEFVTCTAWRGQAKAIATYFKKGDRIYVSGLMKSREYTKEVEGKEETVKIFDLTIKNFEFCERKSRSTEEAADTSAVEAVATTTETDPF